MKENNINLLIDSTMLLPTITEKDITGLSNDAVLYNFKTVAVPPCWISNCSKLLKNTPVGITAPVGFPFGYSSTKSKVAETINAIKDGATEIDMVMNISLLKSRKYGEVQQEIKQVIKAASGRIVKVIIETCYLTTEEKIDIAELIAETGADFVKTSTGFGPNGSSEEDIRILKRTLGNRIQIKAAGGIRSLEQVRNVIMAGATRVGTSNAVSIMNEILNR